MLAPPVMAPGLANGLLVVTTWLAAGGIIDWDAVPKVAPMARVEAAFWPACTKFTCEREWPVREGCAVNGVKMLETLGIDCKGG